MRKSRPLQCVFIIRNKRARVSTGSESGASLSTSKSPTGIRLGKQALSAIREMSTDSALEYAQFMLANMARTRDAKEGFAAFNEKRAPDWTAE